MTARKKAKQQDSGRFIVYLPITGQINIQVAAETEADAIDKAWVEFHNNGPGNFEIEWEACAHVTRGNVCSALLNDQCAEELKP